MFCAKCGNKLDHEKKSCDTCAHQVEDINGKATLDVYVDDVVGKAIKGSFRGIETGNGDWFLYGIIIVVFILYYFL